MSKDGRFIDSPPEGLEGWREVWLQRRRYRSRIAPIFFDWLHRLYEAVFHTHAGRQRDFNIVVTDLVRDLRNDLEGLRRDYRGDLEALRAELRRLNDLIPVASQRNDALIAALDQKIEALASRARDLSLPLLQSAAAGEGGYRGDFVYRRMEEALRGSPAEVRANQQPYVDLARDHQPVIDLGCGRGEFLEMCRGDGVKATGFDSNERSVAELRSKGLDVQLEPIPRCLRKLGDVSVGMIFASHVVEHLPFDPLLELFAEASRVLRRGGVLAIETPNAESITMSASDFWRDPTHLAPRHKAALVTLGREFGFDVVEAVAIHPPAVPDASLQHDAVSRLLFAPADLRLILRRS